VRIRDFKIKTWLLLSFSTILIFVVVIGIIAYFQTKLLQDEIHVLYSHPLQVRRAMDNLNMDIAQQRINTRDLLLLKDIKNQEEVFIKSAIINADIELNFATVKKLYLGPSSDISDAYDSFIVWDTIRKRNLESILNGDTKDVIESIAPRGFQSIKRNDLLIKIKVIDIFAQKKANELYLSSVKLYKDMILQLLLIVSGIFIFTLIIGYRLYRSIRKPIFIMNDAVLKFQNKDMNSRNNYESKNEFGVLAKSINTMSDIIQSNAILNQQTIEISDKMMSINDAHDFFKVISNSISKFSNSQLSAVYLLSEDNKTFRHFESIGLTLKAKEEFSIDELEGEFASVLLTDVSR